MCGVTVSFAGYGEDGFTPSEYELTGVLHPGVNRLEVRVYKRSSASWIEDQDFFRFSGIYRDVYLYTIPEVHVSDLKVQTLLDDTFTKADLVIDTKTIGKGKVKIILSKDRTALQKHRRCAGWGNTVCSESRSPGTVVRRDTGAV